FAGRRLAQRHVGDVHAGVAHGRGDDAGHARAVGVAHYEHVPRRWDVDGVVVDHHDAGLALGPTQRAGNGVVPAAKADQVDVVASERGLGLAHVDAALFGQLRRVDVGHG